MEGVNARALDASDLIAAYEDSTGAAGQFYLEDDEGKAGTAVADIEDADMQAIVSADGGFVPEFDLIVADLSFISQTLVLPAVVSLLKSGAWLLTLVKPQFELQPGQVGKGGIVKDAAFYTVVEQRLRDACAELGLTVTHWFDSPITGGDGNREFFIAARKAGA